MQQLDLPRVQFVSTVQTISGLFGSGWNLTEHLYWPWSEGEKLTIVIFGELVLALILSSHGPLHDRVIFFADKTKSGARTTDEQSSCTSRFDDLRNIAEKKMSGNQTK